MQAQGKRQVQFADWMVALAVLGILVSIGVPNYLGMEKRLRRESLVSQASLAGAELYRWIQASRTAGGTVTFAGCDFQKDQKPIENAHVVERFARYYNEGLGAESSLSRKPLFAVEPPGRAPEDCARDGRIHLIPVAVSDGSLVGAHVVATNTSWTGGPRSDGILASYRTWQGEVR